MRFNFLSTLELQREKLANENPITAVNTLNIEDILGTFPDLNKLEIRDWVLDWFEYRLRQCPQTSGTVYYFSATGSDSNDGLTTTTPKQTLAAAQTLITASSGTITLRFKRGDVWRGEGGLDATGKQFVSIGSYGDTLLARPLFDNFATVDTWSLNSGTTYQRADAGTAICNLYCEGAGLTWGSPFLRCFDLAAVQTAQVGDEAGRFWHDTGTGTLYVNIYGIDPNTLTTRVARNNATNGVYVDSHGCRIEDILTLGYGCDATLTSNQAAGIKLAVGAKEVAVAIRCGAYYCSSHCIHHNTTATGTGGVAVFYRCDAGYPIYNGGSGETVFNGHSGLGGLELLLLDNETRYGTALSTAWYSATSNYRGGAAYSHTGGGANYQYLVCFMNHWCLEGPFMAGTNCLAANHILIDNLPGGAFEWDWRRVRFWNFNEYYHIPAGSGRGVDLFYPSFYRYALYANGDYRVGRKTGTGGFTTAGVGFIVNCSFELDLSLFNTTTFAGIWNLSADAGVGGFYHNAFRFTGYVLASPFRFVSYDDAFFDPVQINNNLVIWDDTNVTSVNVLSNGSTTPQGMENNGYYGTAGDYGDDTSPVNISQLTLSARPYPGDGELYNTGAALAIPLYYDQRFNARDPATLIHLGPLVPASYKAPLSVDEELFFSPTANEIMQ